MSDELEELRGINTKLSAFLATAVEEHQRSTPEPADPRVRSIDRVLTDAGMTTREAGAILGKSRQAVEKQLREAPKAVPISGRLARG